jgi:putative copper export protein
MYQFILITHVLGATIWTGGHLVLTLTILPRALKAKNPEVLLEFESTYEPLGLGALLTQVITGLWLTWRYLPDPSQWFTLDSTASIYVSLKLVLLAATIALAVDARLRVVPSLGPDSLTSFAYHIVSITIIAVLFVVVGVGLGTGGLF